MQYSSIEEHAVRLPYAGEVQLSIVRTVPAHALTADVITQALHRIEEFMGAPFPDDHVIYHMNQPTDNTTSSFFYGGSHVQITLDIDGERSLHYPRIVEWADRPLLEDANGNRYRTIDQTIGQYTVTYPDGTEETKGQPYHVDAQSDALSRAFSGLITLTHEAIHYYFNGYQGNSDTYAQWVVEGPPTFLAYLIAQELNPSFTWPDLNTYYTASDLSPCEVQTLTQAEHLEGFQRLDCMYLLGGRMLEDLHQTMDENNFRAGLRRLYLHTRVNTPACDDDPTPICHVREAFSKHASQENRPLVDQIITRWYGR